MRAPRFTQIDGASSEEKLAGSVAHPRHWLQVCRNGMENLVAAAIGLAAPPRCAACGLEESVSRHGLSRVIPHLCGMCREAVLLPAGDNQCSRCAAPVGPFVSTDHGCIRCRGDRFQFERVIRLGVYRKTLAQLCRSAKKADAEELPAALADLLWEVEQTALSQTRCDLVIPVPHHWKEDFRRTPHAPETLASVLARRLRVRMATHILAKVRRTPKQAYLPPSRRRTNLKGSFRVARRFQSEVEGRRVLLVDDILTTGATANEASRTLRQAGASSVVVAVIARALGGQPDGDRTG